MQFWIISCVEKVDNMSASMIKSVKAVRPAVVAPVRANRRFANRASSTVVRSGRLVGLPAPDFEADAVFDQEFETVKLSDYKYVPSSSVSNALKPLRFQLFFPQFYTKRSSIRTKYVSSIESTVTICVWSQSFHACCITRTQMYLFKCLYDTCCFPRVVFQILGG